MGVVLSAGGAFAWYRDQFARELAGTAGADAVLDTEAGNVPPGADGVTFLPYLQGEKADAPHEALFWRFGQQIAIRKGDWKLVKAPGGGVPQGANSGVATTQGAQLYNLAQDIGEKTNLADKEPEKVKEVATPHHVDRMP